MACRPRRGRAGQLPAPGAVARGRAGLGGRRLPRRRPHLRRRASRGGRTPTALAPGPDRRTCGPLLPRPRRRPHRLGASRPGPPRIRRLGRDRESRPAGLGLPCPAATNRCDGRPRGRPARRPFRASLRGYGRNDRPARRPVRVAGAELGDQHRSAAHPRCPGAEGHDRCHRRTAAAVGRRPAGLAAAGLRQQHRPGQRHRPRTGGTDVGAALRPADTGTAGDKRRRP